MGRYLLTILAIAVSACGPDADELVRAENKKLADMQAAENSRTEGVLARIRYDAEIIAKGGTPDTVSVVPTPMPAPADVPPSVPETVTPVPSPTHPFSIQVGAFTTMEGARNAQAIWVERGFTQSIAIENPKATTVYRFVVRIPGFDGYRATVLAAEKINQEYGIRAFPVESE
jgi:cell division septation protein DedD